MWLLHHGGEEAFAQGTSEPSPALKLWRMENGEVNDKTIEDTHPVGRTV